ncbi:hypothetical protein FGD67_12350 [Colwellia sp. M166]|uniref:hypothetical protein n=1 Tax=Colwellia sp. M166 TaxID=2583805 RepID=UPI00211EC3F1|nr:hypothetical protein [Colwellia sp. M166]UUO23925.1 hypothetical protein FGD67_12350 [Colwellia sp. M166]|tara:strand:- start:979 stop:1686 length:708 start_codon:yes stop_codon:yes gene_type:complete
MAGKTPYQVFNEQLIDLTMEELVTVPNSNSSVELLHLLLKELINKTEGKFEKDSLEKDILDSHAVATHFIESISPQNLQSGGDSLAISFFKLGLAVGRQQGVTLLRPFVKNQAERVSVKSIAQAENKLQAKRKGIDYMADQILNDYIKNHPSNLNYEKKKVKHGDKDKLATQLQDCFCDHTEKSKENCSVVDQKVELDLDTARAKIKQAIIRKVEGSPNNYDLNLTKQLHHLWRS